MTTVKMCWPTTEFLMGLTSGSQKAGTSLFRTVSKQTWAHQHSQARDERRLYEICHRGRSHPFIWLYGPHPNRKTQVSWQRKIMHTVGTGYLHTFGKSYFLVLHSFPTIANVVSVSFCLVLVPRNVIDFCRVTLPPSNLNSRDTSLDF